MEGQALSELFDLDTVSRGQPCLWINPNGKTSEYDEAQLLNELFQAENRLRASDPLLRRLFPEYRSAEPFISSPLVEIEKLAAAEGYARQKGGRWFAKCDHALPVAGSIKARGGFHEVVCFAEQVAWQNGIDVSPNNLIGLGSSQARTAFKDYSIAVGSTGNLGLSIGLLGSALGFKVTVHMSHDAKEWKKRRLREKGVEVVEHMGDYAQAVDNGRRIAAADPYTHFVDDERSTLLFSGYAAAAKELQGQLDSIGIEVDANHPLFIYLPCGVGGAPGGITFGLKKIYGDNVHCFFAEPKASPCMLVQLASGAQTPKSVYDIGLDNRTELDGLAVGQASLMVARLMQDRVAGIFTVTDDEAHRHLLQLHRIEAMDVEPSSATVFAGPQRLFETPSGTAFLKRVRANEKLENATHIFWTTGGSLVTVEEL
ncbi:D-serine ammonia-lyase [Agrobacterium sp. T29]|uniref:D-serine ammonia-lyase n=1 Tax=Agrobacterium sp. T29 TaxID=2580515 RepID=UPI00115D39E8|nr:D-serine ammonia-lyase [Agrobacterium sp. T29]